MKTKLNSLISLPLLGLLAGAFLTGCTTLPNDNAEVKPVKFENILDQRFLEIFLVAGNGRTGDLQAYCYNTQGLNGCDETDDSAPQGLVDKLDVKALAKENKVLATFVNGPRRWCLDWIEVTLGAVREFNGLKATWCATVDMKDVKRSPENNYTSMHISRKSAFGINKGSKVFILDDPQGNTWVMKSYSLVRDPTLTLDTVPAMLARLHLPEGWKYRVKELDADLILVPESGIATIVQDDADNTYDLTGPGFSNYKP